MSLSACGIGNMAVDECRGKVAVAEGFLDLEEIYACFKRMGGVGVAKCAGAYGLGKSGSAGIVSDDAPDMGGGQWRAIGKDEEKAFAAIALPARKIHRHLRIYKL